MLGVVILQKCHYMFHNNYNGVLTMSLSAKAAVLSEFSGEIEIQDICVEDPQEDEVLIEISACGICHTDLIIRQGALPVPLPLVLGHEGAGHVISVGSAVTILSPGDPVILSYGSCGNCVACESNETAYCHEFVSHNFAAQRGDGTTAFSIGDKKLHSHFFGQSAFSTHVVAPIRNVVKAPDDIALDILAPLGCGVQTGAGAILNELKVKAGSAVLVMGAGSVGISAIMAAVIASAKSIIAFDLSESRLELAKKLGATHLLCSDGRSVSEHLESINMTGVDYILDTTGVPALVNEAVGSLNIRGVIGLCAAYPHQQMMEVEMSATMLGGRRIQGIVEGSAYPQEFIPELISYYREGRFPFDQLIEHFAFSDINEAIAATESGRVVKPVLRMKS